MNNLCEGLLHLHYILAETKYKNLSHIFELIEKVIEKSLK